MRRLSLVVIFVLAAAAAAGLAIAVGDLVPDRPPPVEPILLTPSTSTGPGDG
jgi:hypothetical protein